MPTTTHAFVSRNSLSAGHMYPVGDSPERAPTHGERAEARWLLVGSVGAPEVCVRPPGREDAGSGSLRSEASTRSPFDLSECSSKLLHLRPGSRRSQSVGQKQVENRITQRPVETSPDSAVLSKESYRAVHRLQTASECIDVLPNLDHPRDPAFRHGFDRSQVREQRAGVSQPDPAVGHVIGEQEVETFEYRSLRRPASSDPARGSASMHSP